MMGILGYTAKLYGYQTVLLTYFAPYVVSSDRQLWVNTVLIICFPRSVTIGKIPYHHDFIDINVSLRRIGKTNDIDKGYEN